MKYCTKPIFARVTMELWWKVYLKLDLGGLSETEDKSTVVI